MTYAAKLHGTCIGSDIVVGNPCRCCCENCIDMRCGEHDPDHAACPGPKRCWWYKRESWEWKWWQFVYLGGDEWCNPTIVLRLWKPFVFVRTKKLRTEPCEECLSLTLGTWKEETT